MSQLTPNPPQAPTALSIDAILHARPQLPLATSRGRGWSGVTLDVHRSYSNVAESYAPLDHHMVHLCTSGASRLTQMRAGAVDTRTIRAGHTLIMPAGYSSSWDGDAAPSARLRIPTSLVTHAADELGDAGPVRLEVVNVFDTFDPTITRLAQAYVAELDLAPHPCQRLIVDALSSALAAHLLRRYNVFRPVERQRTRGLGRTEITRLTDYIEDNLHRPIGLAELAAIVGVSRFHFCRVFKQTMGVTAFAFVEECRIRRARQLVVETALSLADIALLAGFSDQSHFTRRFTFHVGATPGAFAREYGPRRSRGARSS
ncbi:helix-turn-helix domain-containing protein [Luteibacter aegosomatissinici]|uniref:helix-turn-helix domain-containing protein n=1 Tax=Luteibacter aegosomatissinici TaxID=2911539 RepID=UPI001FFB4E46|nr:AraC family transcriptional regulator [Luteibacter aegosomatissinici]UPG92656.1 helix-turn-helix domain-containing protein [Luteibacter aegosomatissinici]